MKASKSIWGAFLLAAVLLQAWEERWRPAAGGVCSAGMVSELLSTHAHAMFLLSKGTSACRGWRFARRQRSATTTPRSFRNDIGVFEFYGGGGAAIGTFIYPTGVSVEVYLAGVVASIGFRSARRAHFFAGSIVAYYCSGHFSETSTGVVQTGLYDGDNVGDAFRHLRHTKHLRNSSEQYSS